MAVETSAADGSLSGRSNGQTLFAEVDFENGELIFGFDSTDADSAFDLLIDRVVHSSVFEFLRTDSVVLDLLWDVDDDGVIDDALSLSDDQG